MIKSFQWFGVLCLAVVLVGCGGSPKYTGEKRYPLSGSVTYNGQPIDWGAVSFVPLEGDKMRASGGVIQDGKYSVPEAKGANAGKYRIEVRWGKLTGKKIKDQDTGEFIDERKEGLPAKFHTSSTLTAEVSETQTTFDFDLKD